MGKLDTPDLCARLDSLKGLCDELERAHVNSPQYKSIVKRIQVEVNALQVMICGVPGKR